MLNYSAHQTNHPTGLNHCVLDVSGAEVDRFYSASAAEYAARVLTEGSAHVEPHRSIRNRVQPGSPREHYRQAMGPRRMKSHLDILAELGR